MPEPLFPPRPEEVPPPKPELVNVDLPARIERVVIDTIMKRLGSQVMPYAMARILVGLEGDLISELTRALAKGP